MVDVVARAAVWTAQKIDAVRQLIEHTSRHVRANHPKLYSRELIELIFAQPYCRIATVVDRGIAKRQTAAVYLKALADSGVLIEEKVGRDKLFMHRRYVDLLAGDVHTFAPYGVKLMP
jgi:Fic family protein